MRTFKKTIRNVIAIIPARGCSKSIPHKNIMQFCGKPLIAWSIEAARGCRYIEDTYVTTEDRTIADVSQQYGAKIIWRPAELAIDTASSEDALLHAISQIEKDRKVDIVVFLQATSPLREIDDIDSAVEAFASEDADSLFSAAVLEDFCIWEKDNDRLRSVSFDYHNRARRQDRKPYYLENGSIYIFRIHVLTNYKNRLGGGIAYYLMPLWKSYEIDTMDDVDICRYFMETRILRRDSPKAILGNVRLIVYDCDGVLTDNKVILREDGLESVVFNRSDGLAIEAIKGMGIRQIILSQEKNMVVETRARKLGIPVIQGIYNKENRLLSYCDDNRIAMAEVAYIGNEINDIGAMRMVGYPVCPSDACDEVKQIAKIILDAPGGCGVVREFLRHLCTDPLRRADGAHKPVPE